MNNLFLNGEIVRCPDIAALQKKAWELKDKACICRYNVKEDSCQAWQQSISNWNNVKQFEHSGRCMLAGSVLCPGHRQKTELGTKEKSFKIDHVTLRKLASSSMYMYNESKNETLFLSLTFPEFKKNEYNHLLILTEYERNKCLYEINQCFSKFVENLRKTYNCEGYIAVREFGKTNNRVHFHLLCSIPFVPFAKLNSAWCSAISDISVYSKNALSSDPETRRIKKNPNHALRYICKYFSKAKGQYSGTRLVFMSNNIIQRAKNMNAPLESLLDNYKFDYMKQTSDYTTCYRITDSGEWNRYFETFLSAFFELSVKRKQSLYSFPTKFKN